MFACDQGLVAIRQAHFQVLGKSDLFFVCLLKVRRPSKAPFLQHDQQTDP